MSETKNCSVDGVLCGVVCKERAGFVVGKDLEVEVEVEDGWKGPWDYLAGNVTSGCRRKQLRL